MKIIKIASVALKLLILKVYARLNKLIAYVNSRSASGAQSVRVDRDAVY
jgi:hypothetical protein